MNKLLLLSVFGLLTFSQCQVKQDVEFIKIEDVSIEKLHPKLIKLNAVSVFNNPNPVGVKVDNWDINVTANGIDVAEVDLDIPSEIPANGYFLIPIKVEFAPNSVFKIKGGIIAGVLGAVKNKSIKLVYDGHVNIDLLGKIIPVKVYEEKDISF